jgi:hypothetical protein
VLTFACCLFCGGGWIYGGGVDLIILRCESRNATQRVQKAKAKECEVHANIVFERDAHAFCCVCPSLT